MESKLRYPTSLLELMVNPVLPPGRFASSDRQRPLGVCFNNTRLPYAKYAKPGNRTAKRRTGAGNAVGAVPSQLLRPLETGGRRRPSCVQRGRAKSRMLLILMVQYSSIRSNEEAAVHPSGAARCLRCTPDACPQPCRLQGHSARLGRRDCGRYRHYCFHRFCSA